jgi:hypothetical protein
MKRVLETIFAVVVLGGFASVAEAINITHAEVQNGVAVVRGNKAAKQATITWENTSVTQTNNGGVFRFSGVVPADCIGTLSDGVTTVDVSLANCIPSRTPASVPQTGQITSYAPGDDGAIRAGVMWPIPRFTDNANGTVTDNLTGLIWLKNASCLGQQNWNSALVAANTLASGNVACGLADGSAAGDWRLPNIRELGSLVDYATFSFPSLPAGHPFMNFGDVYWSSTSYARGPDIIAWLLGFEGGVTTVTNKPSILFVIAVRGGL